MNNIIYIFLILNINEIKDINFNNKNKVFEKLIFIKLFFIIFLFFKNPFLAKKFGYFYF